MGVIRDEKFILLKKTDVMLKDDKAYVVINASQMNRNFNSFWPYRKNF